MTKNTQIPNLAELRDFLLQKFTAETFRHLFLYTANPDLRPIRHEFAPADGLNALVAKALEYAKEHHLLDALRREADQYDLSLHAPAPPAITPAADGEYLIIVTEFRRDSLARNLDVRNVLADGIRNVLPEDLNARVAVADRVTPQDRLEARSFGERYSATVILWGRYTDNLIEVNFTPLVEQDFPTETQERRVIAQTVDELAVLANDLAAGAVRWLSLLTIGQALYLAGRYSDALAQFDAALMLVRTMELDSRQLAVTFFYRATTHVYQADYGLAIPDYDQAIALFPDSPDKAKAYNNRGRARSALGQHLAAIDDYDQAIALNPEDAIAYNNRGSARSALGQHQAAIGDYDQAIALNPEDAIAYNNRGSARSALGQHQAAIDDYDQAIAFFPDGPDKAGAYYIRGFARTTLGQLEAAIDDYDQAIALLPDGPHKAGAYYNRGFARTALGQLEAAIDDYDQAIALFPDGPDKAVAYYIRGLARNALKEHQAAIDDYDQAIALNPEYASAYYHKARACALVGQDAEACSSLQKAILLDNTHLSAATTDNDFDAIRDKPCFQTLLGGDSREEADD